MAAVCEAESGRAVRSNSLQRMLDLEKQYMCSVADIAMPASKLERLHTQPIHPNSKSQPAASGSTQTSPERPSIQTRRAQGNTHNARRPLSEGHCSPSSLPQPASLIVDTNESLTMSRSDLAMDGGNGFSPNSFSKDPLSVTGTPTEKYSKNVAFEFPPREAARCTSPSWEAYERRKTEKRAEKKAEKKEQEEIRNAKTKRLSKKPPPSSSPKALQQAMAAETDSSRGRRRDRAETTSVAKEPKPPRKARSRSGSFVSMLRAPFEFRRSSQGQNSEAASAGFVGGIKLELKRQAHQQQVLDSSAVDDESNVHPALRKSNQTLQQLEGPPSRTSLHVPMSDGFDGTENQRRYPPITRGSHVQRPVSLTSLPAPTTPDLSKMDRWRAKVGLRPHTRSGSQSDLESATQHHVPMSDDYHQVQPDKGVADQARTDVSLAAEKANFSVVTTTAARAPDPDELQAGLEQAAQEQRSQSRPDIRRMRNHTNNESVSSSVSSGTAGYKTAPSSPPIPEPPRRNYKRSSWLRSNEPMPPLPIAHEMLQQRTNSEFLAGSDSPTKKAVPIFSNGARIRTRRGSRAGGRAEVPVGTASAADPVQSLHSSRSPRAGGIVPASSSEESSSEEFHYTSNVSTPATSRPQSEQDVPLAVSKDSLAKMVGKPARAQSSVEDTTYPLPSAENSEAEGDDPIQAAAEKVLAVFNGIPVKKPALHRRHNSQSSLATEASIEPFLRERPLRLRPRTEAPALISSNVASPASSYLQEARAQPPAVPPARVHKQRLGPPAAFMLPEDSPYATDDTLTPNMSVPDIVGRSMMHKSTPHLKTSDREPQNRIFVECCSCKSYHDMPKSLYEAMAAPERMLSAADQHGYVGALSMTVRCSWCKHEMNVRCCAGLSTTVYIKERLH